MPLAHVRPCCETGIQYQQHANNHHDFRFRIFHVPNEHVTRLTLPQKTFEAGNHHDFQRFVTRNETWSCRLFNDLVPTASRRWPELELFRYKLRNESLALHYFIILCASVGQKPFPVLRRKFVGNWQLDYWSISRKVWRPNKIDWDTKTSDAQLVLDSIPNRSLQLWVLLFAKWISNHGLLNFSKPATNSTRRWKLSRNLHSGKCCSLNLAVRFLCLTLDKIFFQADHYRDLFHSIILPHLRGFRARLLQCMLSLLVSPLGFQLQFSGQTSQTKWYRFSG